MSDAAAAEFGTVARWTAQVAADLGGDYYVPAGCRGSGSPAALDWLLDRMDTAQGDLLLDCGAGVGGPAAYAANARSVAPVLAEPETDACRAARSLFGYPVVRAAGSALPFADGSFDGVWSLGVLCTMSDQAGLLAELRRVARHGAPIGLLVLLAHDEVPPGELQDNDFPTTDRLAELVRGASLDVEHRLNTNDLPPVPDWWNRRVEEVGDLLAARHGHSQAWQVAERQSATIGRLLDAGVLSAELMVLRRD